MHEYTIVTGDASPTYVQRVSEYLIRRKVSFTVVAAVGYTPEWGLEYTARINVWAKNIGDIIPIASDIRENFDQDEVAIIDTDSDVYPVRRGAA